MDFWNAVAALWDGTVGDMPTYVKAVVESETADLDRPIYEDLTIRAVEDLAQLVQVNPIGELHPSREGELVKRFGWLLTTLRDWEGSSDPKGHRLLCTLVVANAWEVKGSDLWATLSPHLQGCAAVIEALDKILCDIRLQVILPPDASKSDHELFDRLLEADRKGDYSELVTLTRSFPTLEYPPLVAASRALYEIAFERLVAIAARQATWLEAINFMLVLNPARRYRVAEHSDFPRIQFATLMLTARRPLHINEDPAIRSLLSQMVHNQSTWKSFLDMLNQSAVVGLPLPDMLGAVLAKASRDAIEEYARSIVLQTRDGDLLPGMTTLAEFRRDAPLEQRVVLWRIVYESWDAWNFNEVNSGMYLAGPVQSNVDLAVIGWLVEGAPEGFIEDQLRYTLKKFHLIEQAWYASVTAFTCAFNRLRSRYAIFALAAELKSHRNQEDWLSLWKDNLPDSLNNSYITARVGIQ